jgi:hypothetical protein
MLRLREGNNNLHWNEDFLSGAAYGHRRNIVRQRIFRPNRRRLA